MIMSGSSTAKKTEITTINIRVVLLASRCLLFSLRRVKLTAMRMTVMMIMAVMLVTIMSWFLLKRTFPQ